MIRISSSTAFTPMKIHERQTSLESVHEKFGQLFLDENITEIKRQQPGNENYDDEVRREMSKVL
jgi:hypothetical protein